MRLLELRDDHWLSQSSTLAPSPSILRDAGGCTLIISDSAPVLGDCHIGDSIAVNGACLTVTEFDKEEHGGYFKTWMANETLDRTDLGDRKVGDPVNLERAMGAHVRFGGHFVQAHVDTTAIIVRREHDGDSLRLWFQLPEPTASRPSLMPYLIPKGYVAIDGASLTLTEVVDAERTFGKADGAQVNIEVDMVGKYVEKSVIAALSGGGGGAVRQLVEKTVKDVMAKENQAPATV
ncbi:Lumazine-binding protein [Melanogaster broomeanus]|nr:Lumazine-binding protein [Melanogaster broomeanus]